MADKLDLDVGKWLSKKSPEQDVLIKDIGINSYQVRYSNVEEKIEELEEMLGDMSEPIASGDPDAQALRQAAANWLTAAPGRTIKGAIAIIKQVAKQDDGEPLKTLMNDVYEAMRIARPKIMSRYSYGPDQVARTAQAAIDQFKKDNRISEARDVPLRIDAPDETLEREVQDIIKGYKETHGKEPNFEEFKEYYKQHSQVNQNTVDYAKKTKYKDAEGQLDEMPSRNPKTGEKVAVPEKKVISWKMSKDMFKKINNGE